MRRLPTSWSIVLLLAPLLAAIVSGPAAPAQQAAPPQDAPAQDAPAAADPPAAAGEPLAQEGPAETEGPPAEQEFEGPPAPTQEPVAGDGEGVAVDEAPPATTLPTAAEVEAELARLAERTDLDEAARAALRIELDQTLDALRRRAAAAEREANFLRSTSEAPGRLAEIQAELAKPAAEPATIPGDATLQQLEAGLAEASESLRSWREQVLNLQEEAGQRQTRRGAVPTALVQAKQLLEDVVESLTVQNGEDANGILGSARRTRLAAERAALEREIAAMEAETASYEARRDLLSARRDRAARREAEAVRRVEAWQAAVSQARQAEARRTASEAETQRRAAAQQHPALREFAEKTKEIAERRAGAQGTAARIDRVIGETTSRRADLTELRRKYAEAKRRIETSGLTRGTGLLLRRHYEQIPTVPDVRARLRVVTELLEDTEYALIQQQDERVGAGDIDDALRRLLQNIDPDDRTPELEQVALTLVEARRDRLDEHLADLSTLSGRLHELDGALRDLLAGSIAYRDFIEERILWVRSIPEQGLPTGEEIDASLSLFTDAEAWAETLRRVRAHAISHWPVVLLATLALGLLLAVQRPLRRTLIGLAELVGSYRTDTFAHTLRALLLTVVLALPVPAVLWWIGWVLAGPVSDTGLGLALGLGFQAAAGVVFSLTLLRRLMQRHGLAEAHFRWPTPVIRSVRRPLGWLVVVTTLAGPVVVAAEQFGDEAASAVVGRIALSIGLLALTIVLALLLRPGSAIAKEAARRQGWLARLRPLWSIAVVATPLALLTMSWLGYHYTTVQLLASVVDTILLATAIVIANAMLTRWLFVARRRVAVEEARRRREQAVAERAASGADGARPSEAVPALDEDKLDLPAISAQTKQVFRTAIVVTAVIGAAVVWANVLPALRMLDRVELWPDPTVRPTTEEIAIDVLETGTVAATSDAEGQETRAAASAEGSNGNGSPAPLPGLPATPGGMSGSGGSSADGGPETLSITLADVGLSLLLLVATVIAFRNLPGLAEFMFLQRLPLDAGSRYALSTVLRYGIGIVGTLLVFSALGISWSKVQWLVAALTFGLAFGLQEIFANFVSGLIILAERPIRVGDTVTVGNVSGSVSRIRMRATTITDWDRKELVIPNKNFITGDIINWTLTDPVLRLIVPVGVSYDTDTEHAERVLMRIAAEHPTVLKEPKPYVLFNSFGASTLDLELRVFLPSVDVLLAVKHDLHQSITKIFREEKIEIAYPQRDLHVRSIGDLRELVAPRELHETA